MPPESDSPAPSAPARALVSYPHPWLVVITVSPFLFPNTTSFHPVLFAAVPRARAALAFLMKTAWRPFVSLSRIGARLLGTSMKSRRCARIFDVAM